jgi:hypothetical protein
VNTFRRGIISILSARRKTADATIPEISPTLAKTRH